MSKRAERRHHRRRLFAKRMDNQDGRLRGKSYAAEVAAKWVDTPKPCSCWMCCNYRRLPGMGKTNNRAARLTVQERRAAAACEDEY